MKMKNYKTLYPTVKSLRIMREQCCYLYLLDTGSSCWLFTQRKKNSLLTAEEDFLIFIETIGPLGYLLFPAFDRDERSERVSLSSQC